MSFMLIFLLTLRYMYIPLITVNLAIHGIITSTDLLTANLPALSLFVWYSIVHTECYKKNIPLKWNNLCQLHKILIRNFPVIE